MSPRKTSTSFLVVRGPRTATIPDPADLSAQLDDGRADTIVGTGTIDQIVQWAAGNPARIAAALAANNRQPKPRKTLPARLADHQ